MLKVQTSILFLTIMASSQVFSMEMFSLLKGYAAPNATFEEGENTLNFPPKGHYGCYRIKELKNLYNGNVQIDFEDQQGCVNTAVFTNDIQKGMLKRYLDGQMSASAILDECKKDPTASLGVRLGGHNSDSKIHLFYISHPGYSEEWHVKQQPIFVPKSKSSNEINFNRPNEMSELDELKKLLKYDAEALSLANAYIIETKISVKEFINNVKKYPKALIIRGALPQGFIVESQGTISEGK